MWLTVDLVDVALDLSLREELVVDVSLRVGVLHLLLEPRDKNTVSKTNFTAEYHHRKTDLFLAHLRWCLGQFISFVWRQNIFQVIQWPDTHPTCLPHWICEKTMEWFHSCHLSLLESFLSPQWFKRSQHFTVWCQNVLLLQAVCPIILLNEKVDNL